MFIFFWVRHGKVRYGLDNEYKISTKTPNCFGKKITIGEIRVTQTMTKLDVFMKEIYVVNVFMNKFSSLTDSHADNVQLESKNDQNVVNSPETFIDFD